MIEFSQTAIGYVILFVGGIVTALSTLAAFLYTVWITVAFIFRKFDGLAKYVEFWIWYKCRKGQACQHQRRTKGLELLIAEARKEIDELGPCDEKCALDKVYRVLSKEVPNG